MIAGSTIAHTDTASARLGQPHSRQNDKQGERCLQWLIAILYSKIHARTARILRLHQALCGNSYWEVERQNMDNVGNVRVQRRRFKINQIMTKTSIDIQSSIAI